MNLNVEISPDQERILNDILEKGINDLRRGEKENFGHMRGNSYQLLENSYKRSESSNKIRPSNDSRSPFNDIIHTNIHNVYNKYEPTNSRSNHNVITNSRPYDYGSKFQFSQMRDEISHLQGKIEAIEKKYAINNQNKLNKTHSDFSDKPRVLFTENQHFNTVESESIYNKSKDMIDRSPLLISNKYNTMKSPVQNENYRKINNNDYRQATTETSVDLNELKQEYINIIRNWKNKYMAVSQDYENLKAIFQVEKQKNLEIERLRSMYEDSIKEVNGLKGRLSEAYEEKDMLMSKYNQSESIRVEQSRLIQSLNNEIEKLNSNNKTNVNTEIVKPTENIEKDKKKVESRKTSRDKSNKDKTKKKNLVSIKSKSLTKDKKVNIRFK